MPQKANKQPQKSAIVEVQSLQMQKSAVTESQREERLRGGSPAALLLRGCWGGAGGMLGGCWRDAPGPPRQQEPEPSAGRAGFGETEECWCHLEGITRLKSAEIVTHVVSHDLPQMCSIGGKKILERRALSHCHANYIYNMSSSSVQLKSSSQYSLQL